MAQLIPYKEVRKNSIIYEVNDEANHFYVILNGSVSRKIRNPDIDEWDWAMSVFKALEEWKKKEFDVKA